jgi:hypothetical protein
MAKARATLNRVRGQEGGVIAPFRRRSRGWKRGSNIRGEGGRLATTRGCAIARDHWWHCPEEKAGSP